MMKWWASRRRGLGARGAGGPRGGAKGDVIESNGLAVDRVRREIRVHDEVVGVTPTEFRILETLARAAGRTFTRQELVERALGEDYDGLDRTVDVHIMNLRRKLGEAGKAVVTVFGVGYRFAK